MVDCYWHSGQQYLHVSQRIPEGNIAQLRIHVKHKLKIVELCHAKLLTDNRKKNPVRKWSALFHFNSQNVVFWKLR